MISAAFVGLTILAPGSAFALGHFGGIIGLNLLSQCEITAARDAENVSCHVGRVILTNTVKITIDYSSLGLSTPPICSFTGMTFPNCVTLGQIGYRPLIDELTPSRVVVLLEKTSVVCPGHKIMTFSCAISQ